MSDPTDHVFSTERDRLFHPPAAYACYRDSGMTRVMLGSGQEVWVLGRHRDVRALLADTRFSSDRFHPNFPALAKVPPSGPRRFDASLIGMDPPHHQEARRLVAGEFSTRRVDRLRGRIQEIADRHVDRMIAAGSPADLVAAVSVPVPCEVLCHLLGVPEADREFVLTATAQLLSRDTEREVRARNVTALQDYLDQLVSAKEEQPTDDLLGRQVLRRRGRGVADHDSLVSLASLLLMAGHETTANMISLGAMALALGPARRRDAVRTASGSAQVVEEALRYFTITDLITRRVATADVELNGGLIRAGEGAMGLTFSANRDPEVFADPDEFRPDRGARHHMAFGFGPHQCLGQNLARVELRIVLGTLFLRLPDLRLACAPDDLPFKRGASVFGLHRLPVRW